MRSTGTRGEAVLRAIIFDKDGTLFDFHETWSSWAADALLHLAGGDGALAMRLADAVGFDLMLRQFHPDSPAVAGTSAQIAVLLAPHLPGWREEQILLELHGRASTVALAQAAPLAPLLDWLAARHLVLGLATNDSEEGARGHLGEAGVLSHFDLVLGYDSGFGAKPDPGMLLAFCDQFGFAPHEVAMVGDSLHDLHAGRAAGMRTIGVLTGMAQAEDLGPLSDRVLPHVGHLPDWVSEQRLPLRARRLHA
jgi:phosphoglycolate phosphatase